MLLYSNAISRAVYRGSKTLRKEQQRAIFLSLMNHFHSALKTQKMRCVYTLGKKLVELPVTACVVITFFLVLPHFSRFPLGHYMIFASKKNCKSLALHNE